MQGKPIRIGTRGSPLALAQAGEVSTRLRTAHGLEERDIEIVVIKTTGDAMRDRPLTELGGKGLFTKEIEEALIANSIDLAVHSMKDMLTDLPDGLAVGAVLPREDVRDAFISLNHRRFDDLPLGTVVGTSSLRRQAQVKKLRPDLQVIPFRGNVETRLQKLELGAVSATFLACAGLNRLGLADKVTMTMPTDVMLPAVGQGAIGIETRSDDTRMREIIAVLSDYDTAVCIETERAFLKVLEGSCRTPIAGLASFADGRIEFRGETLSPDGERSLQAVKSGQAASAAELGADAAHDLLARGARELFG